MPPSCRWTIVIDSGVTAVATPPRLATMLPDTTLHCACTVYYCLWFFYRYHHPSHGVEPLLCWKRKIYPLLRYFRTPGSQLRSTPRTFEHHSFGSYPVWTSPPSPLAGAAWLDRCHSAYTTVWFIQLAFFFVPFLPATCCSCLSSLQDSLLDSVRLQACNSFTHYTPRTLLYWMELYCC